MTDYRVLVEVTQYPQAVHIVDGLSDAGFPVEHTRIVGTDIETVEDVHGRKTVWTSALMGALSGLWFGIFVGLMFWILAPGLGLLANFGWPVLFGVLFGGFWGLIAHALTGGRRDFTSTHGLRAHRYEVQVRAEYLARAYELLSEKGIRPTETETSY